jgi:hypothetical protein
MTLQVARFSEYHLYAYIVEDPPERYDLLPYVTDDITGSYAMKDNKPMDRVGETGTISFTLNNVGRQFTPGHSSALAGWRKGTKLDLVMVYDNREYIVRYKIDDIRIPTGWTEETYVAVTALDWMDYAAKHPISNPGILTNKRGDEVLEEVLSLMDIQPSQTEFDVGISIFPTVLDTITSHTKAYNEFGKVAFSEGGYVYLRHNQYGDILIFENRHRRHGWNVIDYLPLASIDSGYILNADGGGYVLKPDGFKLILNQRQQYTFDDVMVSTEAVYGKDVINHMTVQANPRRFDTSPQILFSLDAPFAINSGSTVLLRGNYADPLGGLPISGQNMITPVITTDYLANTKSDGTGTNISTSLSISVDYGTEGFAHSLTNNNANTMWITKFNCRGYGIYIPNPITHVEKDNISIGKYEVQPETLNQLYQNTLGDGTVLAASIVNENSEPRTVIKKINLIANRSPSLMLAFLRHGPGNFIHAIDNELDKEFSAYIQGVNFKIQDGGIVRYSWIVKEARSLASGLSPLIVEFNGLGSNDAIDFGYVPDIADLEQRSISLWFYATDQGASGNPTIFGYGPIYTLYITSNTESLQLQAFQRGVANAITIWETDNNSVPYGQWVHLVLIHDVSTWPDGTLPTIYINGSTINITASLGLPVGGTKVEETGSRFVIGNVYYDPLSPFSRPFLGKIKDFRVYNKLLTASEVSQIYNAGTQDYEILSDSNSGIAFQSFAVRTEDISLYEDEILTESMRVMDNIFGAVGDPNDEPIGRTS